MQPTRSVDSLTWETLGTSRDGRAVRATTIVGSGAGETGGRARRKAAVIAGIHGDEREGGRHLQELLALLLTSDDTVRVYEDVNPDGTARGSRTTVQGVDPNRNWPAKNFQASRQCGPEPLSEPGVAAVHGDLVDFAPDIVIVLHSTRRGPFVNFDGPAEREAAAFAEAAGPAWSVQPSMGYPTPGSLGSWMGVDRQVPILTIEFDRDCAPEVSGPALLAGVAAVLGGRAPTPERWSTASQGGPLSGQPDDEFHVR
ncbi:murein peptide amidase A [Planctomycetes bacterium Poly30]|uniref:Murein peptide amidase A n=1 Tax=Saltatorellus ferox TaxID=2528018 RepID=A0A518F0U8_9BACT|nr:murein peptide amidase A [Planctomycetes bacterium Poly30]